MRTSQFLIPIVVAALASSACTVKDVDAPAFAGPSTLAYSISLTSNTDTLIQDGASTATIQITARDPMGQEITGRPLRAEILVDGVAQDYGVLSTKNPVTGQTIRYTAPPASTLTSTAQTVTIAVTPTDSGDFRSEVSRQIDIRLVPQGVILPTNPSLVANFTVTPASPLVLQTASFDASTTTNGGSACGVSCLYAWNFGDGTTANGQTVTHEFRTAGNVQVTLVVTDNRGATSPKTQTVTVQPGALPTVPAFLVSPTPASVNQDVFFSAENATVVAPRRIVSYDWNFGDGAGGSGVTTSHRYRAAGTYVVVLTVTDDAGASNRVTANVTVAEGLPTVTVAVSPASPFVNKVVSVNVTATPASGATIASYSFNWGDGSAEEFSTSNTQTHTYTVAGTYTLTVRVTDSVGRTRSTSTSIVVQP